MMTATSLAAEGDVGDEQVAQPPVHVEGHEQSCERDRDHAEHSRRRHTSRRKPLSSSVVLVIGGCAASSAPPTPSHHARPDSPGARPGSAVARRSHDADTRRSRATHTSTGRTGRQPDAAGAADIAWAVLRAGQARRAGRARRRRRAASPRRRPRTPRRLCRGRRRRIRGSMAAAGRDEQRDREPVAHPIGPAGDVARPATGRRGRVRWWRPAAVSPAAS